MGVCLTHVRFIGNIVCSISSYAVDGLKGCLCRLFVSLRTLLVTPVQLLFGANIQTVNLMTESHWVRTEICPKLYSNAQPEHLNEEEQLGGGG